MTMEGAKTDQVIPDWSVSGDWFDVCSCFVPCPCTYAQAPTGNACDAIFAYKIRAGHYGETRLEGLKVVLIGAFTGNLWTGDKADAAVFFDASADEAQREALRMIFTGAAGGWMKQFFPAIGTLRGVEFADITVEVEETLEHWRVEIPEVMRASGEALTGPTADPNKRIQTFNPPGSEVGPTEAAVTWGKSVDGFWRAFGFDQDLPAGRNSKHIPFDWSGPDA